jgi:hypothetical protein
MKALGKQKQYESMIKKEIQEVSLDEAKIGL